MKASVIQLRLRFNYDKLKENTLLGKRVYYYTKQSLKEGIPQIQFSVPES